ncbi:beta-1,3-glucan-binding protein 1 [Osmia lignaria lignaria]|uniref:beta-1,3-glucan-binding protein 1 n=1 Tax=Osmia lignaria lignaria TaxID=1437193 RepID=UPI00402B31E0
MFNYSVMSVSIFVAFVLSLESFIISVNSYVLPEPTFKILKPRGIQISIPDTEGLQFFAFHGNINKKIEINKSGEILGEVYKKKDDKWTVTNEDVNLKNGDVIHYWTYALVNGSTYQIKNKKWTVTSQIQGSDNSETPSNSVDKLVFNENFDSLNTSIWKRDVKIPLSPDYEFCVYHNEHHDSSVKVENGVLRFTPLILEDIYGENVTAYGTLVLSGCTSNIEMECSRKAAAFNILPPIISARITTTNSFYFQYGKIEIRAKFPEGDWLYPEMWLEPKYNNYGVGYSSGRVILGLARGNHNLVNVTANAIYDSRRLEFGCMVGTAVNHVDSHIVSKIRENGPRWTKDFHIFTTIWNSDGFEFMVDGEQVGKLNPGPNEWMQGENVNKIAPFDKEFYITLGVGVGGIRMFPDGTTSSGYVKPWRNVEAKAMLQFWRKKSQWMPSLKQNGRLTAFEIDYIRVWSL